MKHVKKLASILLAMVMVFSLTTTAFADDTQPPTPQKPIGAPSGSTAEITAPSNTRSYYIYQIFAGDLSGTTLSNVKWGVNGIGKAGESVPEETLNALADVNAEGKTDIEKLAEIKKYAVLTGAPVGIISNGSKASVPTGYYLIQDKGAVNDKEEYSLHMVKLVANITITPKASNTTSEKKVDDKNDSNKTEDETNWQDSADYDIGDQVPFQLKATITDQYDNYKTYKLTFHDKEDAGLKFDKNTVKVFVDETEITTGYEVVTENLEDGDTFEVRFADLKKIDSVHKGSVITVTYKSELTSSAVIGSTGNKNTMHITYSNNPNDEEGGENGKTPDDTVIVFTFKTIVNKVEKNPNYEEGSTDEDKKDEFIPLTGADFELYKFVVSADGSDTYKEQRGSWTKLDHEETWSADTTTFTFKGLDAGEYKLHESKTPAGYNTVEDILFTITAEHVVESDNPTLTSLSGGDKFTGEVVAGEVKTDVENNKGSQLPETGGIGTTIFYVLGGILVVAAAILLVTKKRMSAEK